jgi:hypothetical protein
MCALATPPGMRRAPNREESLKTYRPLAASAATVRIFNPLKLIKLAAAES